MSGYPPFFSNHCRLLLASSRFKAPPAEPHTASSTARNPPVLTHYQVS